MADVHHVFRNVLLTRLIRILLWHICIQTLVLQFIGAVDFGEECLFWTVTWLKNLVTPRIFAILFFQFLLSVVFIGTECTQYLKANSCDAVSRFRYLCQKLSPNNLVWLFVYLLRGILSMIVFFIALKDYFVNANTVKETNDVTETIIIMLCNAACINFLFFVYDFVYQKSFRYFSLVQNRKNVILPTILVTLKDVSIKSFYYCLIFVSFYLLKGHSLSSFMCDLFSVKCHMSYSTIFNPFVLYCLWLLNAFLLFNNSILKLLFDVFLTGRIDFPINDNPATESETFTLTDALSMNNVPVLQYLGYYDLNIASQFDKAKRQQIFSLSYPGGHSHVWKHLLQEAIKLIVETNEQLEKIASIKPKYVEMDKYNAADYAYTTMRSLSSKQFLYEKTHQPERAENSFVYKVTTILKTFRPIAYFLEEMTEKQLECSLQHYQSLSLACYSLANLAVASKSEDKYGVVQQDLPVIINALARLYVTLNKLVVVVNRRSNASVLQIKKYLVNVVKSSLYKLSTEFGHYVKDIALSAEDEKLFTSFINFKN